MYWIESNTTLWARAKNDNYKGKHGPHADLSNAMTHMRYKAEHWTGTAFRIVDDDGVVIEQRTSMRDGYGIVVTNQTGGPPMGRGRFGDLGLRIEVARYSTSSWSTSRFGGSLQEKTLSQVVEQLNEINPQFAYRIVAVSTGTVVWERKWNDIAPLQEENIMEYEARQPLHVPREKLIEKLNAWIAERKEKHDEAMAKERAKNEELVARFEKLVAEHPEAVANLFAGYWGRSAAVFEDDNEERALREFAEANPAPGTAEFQPDPAATKLVSVLEAADDEKIEVTPSDDFYKYL